ncbi:right-handed parallel beta-helix repeat-containing protein [Larkinella sp.]|uniref:right-handed parallel beta-helix repeat-containing protein n=1 Tax=Larkinella sp. TaxID=2034517 RepID=UPI003BA98887
MKKRFTFLFPTAWVGALRTRFFWLGCLLGLSLVASAQTTTRFVSTTGTNSDPYTATSWATATSDLQGAINSIQFSGGEVWVAGGTYKPTTGTDRTIYFSMKNNVAIYGGFVGTEANRSERPALNMTTPSSTTLSGDIGTEGDPGDNSYHVISNTDLTSTAILDGFVITGGRANYDDTSDNRNNGGGMLNINSSPILTNCSFTSNSSKLSGGGMYNAFNSNPSLINCRFTSNTADNNGGGMYNTNSSPGLTSCSFTSNTAIINGGGMANNSVASPTLTNCSFTSNTAGTFGGGIANYLSDPSLINCSFTSNIANYGGGGMSNATSSNPSLTNCSFTSNTAVDNGGGMSNSTSSPSLTNCRFISNTATLGGGMVNSQSNPSLTNCTFASNTASQGGGLYNSNSSPSLTNCTFASNTATNQGGGMYNTNSSNSSLINCIFWNNGGSNTLFNIDGATTTASYCLFEPSVTGYTDSNNNLTTTTSPFVSSDNLQLTNCSVAVNAGDPASATAVSGPYSVTALPQTDLAGNPRIFGSRVDIGAYEFQDEPAARITVSTLASSGSVTVGQAVSLSATVTGGSNLSYGWAAPAGATLSSTSTNPVSATLLTSGPKAFTVTVTNLGSGCTATSSVTVTGNAAPSTTRFVSTTGTNSNPATATSWATATADLQGAINSLTAGGEVWVAAGTYKPTTGTDRTIYFSMKNNVAIYGGFVGTEANRSERPALNLTTPSSTTLSGDIGNEGDPADNSYHVISNTDITSTAILDGFVITGGNANDDNTLPSRGFGGGMLNAGSSPILTNCSFTSNSANSSGGGMFNSSSSPILTNCSFTSNSANEGGGMFNRSSNANLTNCSFTSNSADRGGGMYNINGSSPSLTHCSFTSNSAVANGGGVYNLNISSVLVNCRFTSNTANEGGGMYTSGEGNTLLTNCSFSLNTATNLGGGILSRSSSNLSLVNCLFWNNGGSSLRAIFGPKITASYCLFEPEATDYTGSNNLTATTSPFVSSDNLQLTNCSAAVNAGDPASATAVSGPYSVTALPQTDFAGNPRIYGNRVDIGAYEFQDEPAARITVSTLTSSASVCVGQSVSLSATVAGGSNLSYSWAAPAGATLSSTSTNPVSATLLTSGPKAFTVTVTNLSSGCTATSSVTVTGNAAPAPPNLTSTTVTQGAPTVNLTASNCAGTLTWNGPGGSSGTGAIAVLTTNPGIFVYQATCTVNGCISDPASATVVVNAPTVTGSFDGFIYGGDCTSFRGWAWDRNKPNTVVTVEILVDSESKGTILANEFRQDLKDGGKGNGIHAFRWNIPDELKDGEVHTLSATVFESGFTLKDGPKTIRCQNGTPPPPPNKPPVAPSMTPLTIQQGVAFTTTLPVFTDPENSTLSYALAGLPSGLTFTSGTRQISGKTEIAGSFALTYSATDDRGATNSVSFNLTVNPAETVVTGSFEGYLDKLDCGGIRGWVWDRNKPNTPITVEFYLEPSPGTITPLGSIIANIYRVDLKDAGKGNGVHAYNFTPPGSVTNGTKVLARVLGSTFILKGSPKEYQCAPGSRLSAETSSDLQVTVLGNPVSSQVEVEIRGAEGNPLHVQLTDINGHRISEQQVPQADAVERHRLPVFHQAPGMLVLRVSTPTQQKTVRILKGK